MTRSWVEISKARLKANVKAVRQRIPQSTAIIAVLKADAYGHGISSIGRELFRLGIVDFAVGYPEEGVELRKALPEARILVLAGFSAGEEDTFVCHRLASSVFDSRPVPSEIPIEVKIDTGMTRLGVPWREAAGFIKGLSRPIAGVYSHFASSESDPDSINLQLERFLKVTRGLSCRRHIANSSALAYPRAHLDAVRVGLALYGYSLNGESHLYRPLLSWKTRLLSVRDVPAGSAVGYNGTFVTGRDSRIGILPVGYADGYSRALSNRGSVRIRGRLAPVIGRVSMDLTTVDLTGLPDARPGEEVTLLEDEPGSPINAVSLASQTSTIPYEILTSIGDRVARIYK